MMEGEAVNSEKTWGMAQSLWNGKWGGASESFIVKAFMIYASEKVS